MRRWPLSGRRQARPRRSGHGRSFEYHEFLYTADAPEALDVYVWLEPAPELEGVCEGGRTLGDSLTVEQNI